jgi:glycosyltransferase involved in cell wall biosynthesis
MINDFTLIITTYNRLDELKQTLGSLEHLLFEENLNCIICDDGSADGTFDYVRKYYPKIKTLRNSSNQGLIYCRNRIMERVKTKFAISLDDDANFLIDPNFNAISQYFQKFDKCAILSMRIFWGSNPPNKKLSLEKPIRVKGFAGGAHVMRTSAWYQIPDYPEWFKFYGEEDFVSFHLFKKGLEVHYYPDILIHHRVDIKSRKKNKDYIQRTRRSLRSGWYLYLMFYPKRLIAGRMTYSIWIQLKTKVFKGDFKALIGMKLALLDLILNSLKAFKNSNRLSIKEFILFENLQPTKIYWSSK